VEQAAGVAEGRPITVRTVASVASLLGVCSSCGTRNQAAGVLVKWYVQVPTAEHPAAIYHTDWLSLQAAPRLNRNPWPKAFASFVEARAYLSRRVGWYQEVLLWCSVPAAAQPVAVAYPLP